MRPDDKPIKANLDYKTWEMPDLTGIKRSIAKRLSELENQEAEQEELDEALLEPTEPELELPSEEEIEALIAAAQAEGYTDGFANGQEEGFAQGQAEGLAAGTTAGEAEGYQAGLAKGLAEGQAQITAKANRLSQLINSLLTPLAKQETELEHALISLVDQLTRQVLRRELALDTSHLTQVLQESLAALPEGTQRLRVYCHPEDLSQLEAIKHLEEDLRFIAKPSLTKGSLEIESLQSLVDATLETRYKKILNQLLDAAYANQGKAVTPLAEEVLATPNSTPLEELTQAAPVQVEQAAAVEPSEARAEASAAEALVPEAALPEATAAVALAPSQGLQKSRAPRNLPPLNPIPSEAAAEALLTSDLEKADLEEAETPAEAELSAKDALLAVNKIQQLEAAKEEAKQSQTEQLTKVDEYLDELAAEEIASSEAEATPEADLEADLEAELDAEVTEEPAKPASINAESYLGG